MFLIRSKKRSNHGHASVVANNLKEYVGLNQTNSNAFTRAARDYAVQSCLDNISSLNYGLENKLISGKPYTMSELYEQAIHAEKAFTAGIHWAFQYSKRAYAKTSE